jgi:hypothetical protein
MSSPYNNPSTTTGFYDQAHTSTANLVYEPRTLPTPWPILIIGFVVSFLTALWATISNFKQHKQIQRSRSSRQSSTIILSSLTILILIITSIRSVSALIQTIRATQNGNNRAADILALCALLISNCQYIFMNTVSNPYELRHIHMLNMSLRFLAGIDILFVLISSFTLFSMLVNDDNYYAKWFLEGGTCPVPVDGCSQLAYVGCRVSAITGETRINAKNLNTVNNANFLRLEQLLTGIFLIATLISMLPFLLRQRKIIKRNGVNVTSESALRAYLRLGACFLIVILAVISLSLTAVQERNPKAIHIIDSFGAVLPASSSNGSSWSDCFVIKAPANQYGFLDVWWTERRSKVVDLLSLT